MSYLRYLCLFEYSGLQQIVCCVFVLFFLCCQFLWIVLFIGPSVFSNVYFVWIGKCRKGAKSKGGVGMCTYRDIVVLDEHLKDTHSDSFKRLLILSRINFVKVAVGVAYVPSDGIDKERTDALFYQLLET